MFYEAEFESNLGRIRAVWNGGPCIHLYPEESEEPTQIVNVWDYQNDKPTIEPSTKAVAERVREWLWEMERGIEFERILTREIDEFSDSDGAW
jgi:hypothetical protein